MKRAVDPILLVMCPTWGTNMPPLGIAYLTGYLRSQGWVVHALDLNVEVFHRAPPEMKRYWREEYLDLWLQENFMDMIGKKYLLPEIEWSVERILSRRPAVVGFSVNQANLYFSFQVAERLRAKDPGLIIMFGGPGVYWVDRTRNLPIGFLDWEGHPMLPLDTIDVFIHGDGEETAGALLNALAAGEDLDTIGSITARIDGAYKTTGPHRPNRYIDAFPIPEFEWCDFDLYQEIELGSQSPARIVPILLSRGCTNNCKFCNDFVMQGKYRFRKPESVFEEMRFRVEREGLNRFFFCDLLVNGNLEQLRAVAERMMQLRESEFARCDPRYRYLSWTGQALARADMNEEYLHLLFRSGCGSLSYGVESLSDKVLLGMRKNITVADISSVLKASKAAGLYNQINLIVGYPGEGEKEFQETIDNLRRLRQYIDRVSALSMLTLTFGSPLFVEYKRAGGLRNVADWHRQWVSDEGQNTFEVRSERWERLQAVLQELELVTLLPQHYEKAFAGARAELTPGKTC